MRLDLINTDLPEGNGKVHKVSWFITDCHDSWLGIDDPTIVIFYLVHTVDDVSLRTVLSTRTNEVDLENENKGL